MEYTKIDNMTFQKVVAQEPVVITKTLDELYAEKAQYEQGIVNNQTLLDAVLIEIAAVEGLGVKTQAEVQAEIAVEAPAEEISTEPTGQSEEIVI